VGGTNVDEVADELYALHPAEFVAARDARAKQARAAGDREGARRISGLRKPTVVAWLANLLARERADSVRPLLELGAALREATETLSGPQLRDLSRQRNELVGALVREARTLGAAAGQRRLGEDTVRGLEATLHAALADPQAAQQLIEGRLTEGLTHSGFAAPSVATPKSSARNEPPTRKRAAPDERRAAQRAKLEDELGAAWADAGQAAESRDAAADAARRAERDKAEASREVARLRGGLEAAEAELRLRADEHDSAAAALKQADREVRRTRERVASLQARLDNL
jgi:chromosome segregation ATPase